ncbi:MAG: NADH-quinone oxidoreductase subunit M [Betaproteobacteria bacterium]
MDTSMFGSLSIIIWLPIFFGALVLLIGQNGRDALARRVSVLGAVLGAAVVVPVWLDFDRQVTSFQFVEKVNWIDAFNIYYHLGIDGLSLLLIALNCVTTIFVIVAGWQVITQRVSQYNAAFLILSGMMNGVFCSLDAMLFYVFFEATLIPMFIIVGVWGGPNRVYAAIKFFLYTLAGSLLTLVALIYLYRLAGGSFSLQDLYAVAIPHKAQILIFLALFAAFAVKIPMWPVHTWLPDAHVEAPTGGSVVLAAVMLKLGGYGFLRLSLPIVPDAARELAPLVIGLSLIAIVYIGFVALIQRDMKKLIAYSSISHMGFVTLGIFLFNAQGIQGAVIQMISHGFISGALFLCVGVLYDRLHSRQISDYGGVANTMPVFAALFLLFAMANAGLPGTSGFIGEFFVIMGAMEVNFWFAFAAAMTLILGAGYSLWMYKRVVFGEVGNEKVGELTDINLREKVLLGVLALIVLGMGVYPYPFTEIIGVSVDHLIDLVNVTKY